MHPRNKYLKGPADFGELAECRPSLKPFLIDKRCKKTEADPCEPHPSAVLSDDPTPHHPQSSEKHSFKHTINFSDPNALRELTCAVLEKDFDLKLEIPPDRLIPTVPQKLNYIHWIEDLLVLGGMASDERGVTSKNEIPKGHSIVGIDIGTGTSCIYPMLGARLNQWHFIATDITQDTVQYALENVARNNLQDHIQVKLVSEECMLKGLVKESAMKEYAFCMCNPPFFSSEEERLGGSVLGTSKRPPPSTFTHGTSTEVVTEGGEVGFVRRMIEDSLEVRDQIRWYTCMLGKKSSLKELVSVLERHQVPVVTTSEFVQGKTWRWGIAWSFDASLKSQAEQLRKERKRPHPPSSLLLPVKAKDSHIPHLSLTEVPAVKKWLEMCLKELEIQWTCSSGGGESCDGGVVMLCSADKVTWTHQRKRRRLMDRLKPATSPHAKKEEGKDGSVKSSPGTKQVSGVSPFLCEEQNLTSQTALTLESPKTQPQTVQNSPSVLEERRKIELELEFLNTPCKLKFSICIKFQEAVEGKAKKKVKASSGRPVVKGKGLVCLEMTWLSGDTDNKDMLHQLLQYIQNKLDRL